MAGIYSEHHPERTVFYRVVFRYFDKFLSEYERRFEREYGYFRPVIQEVVEKYLDCGNPRCGFACIRCPDCGEERAEVEQMDYLGSIARATSHIPDKGQVMVCYYGLYSNAQRGKICKAEVSPFRPPIIEGQYHVPSRGWAEMIRKVYEIGPLICPSCRGQMRIIAFIENPKAINKIIRHLKLTFEAERPPPSQLIQQELLVAAEQWSEYL